MTREQHAYHGIQNEIVAAWLIESIYAADKLAREHRSAAITLPRAAYHELPAAHVVDAMNRRAK